MQHYRILYLDKGGNVQSSETVELATDIAAVAYAALAGLYVTGVEVWSEDRVVHRSGPRRWADDADDDEQA